MRAVLMQQNFLLGARACVCVSARKRLASWPAFLLARGNGTGTAQRSRCASPMGPPALCWQQQQQWSPVCICVPADEGCALLVLGLSTTGDEDPLEGLTPAQIVMFCEKYGIDPTDPLEVRLTPPRALPASGQQPAATATAGQQATTATATATAGHQAATRI